MPSQPLFFILKSQSLSLSIPAGDQFESTDPPKTELTLFNIYISFMNMLPFVTFAFSHPKSLFFSTDITGVPWTTQFRWESCFVQLKGFGYHNLTGSLPWVIDSRYDSHALDFILVARVSPERPSQLCHLKGGIPSCKSPNFRLSQFSFLPTTWPVLFWAHFHLISTLTNAAKNNQNQLLIYAFSHARW